MHNENTMETFTYVGTYFYEPTIASDRRLETAEARSDKKNSCRCCERHEITRVPKQYFHLFIFLSISIILVAYLNMCGCDQHMMKEAMETDDMMAACNNSQQTLNLKRVTQL